MMNAKEGIVVLSLFDGMSCGHMALDNASVKIDKYIASEIEPSAIANTQKRYPNTIQIGDVTKVYYNKWNKTLYANCERVVVDNISRHPQIVDWTRKQKRAFEDKHLEVCDNGNVYKWFWKKATPIFTGEIDLILSGSPCQSFSSAHYFSYGKKEYGLDGKSGLFYEFLRILKEANPTYYFFENVKMKKESEEELSNYLKAKAIHINSNLVTYQNRERIYFTNIKGITMPRDMHVSFQDYKITTLPRIESVLRKNHSLKVEEREALALTSVEIDDIIGKNLWVYDELKAINPKISKEEVVKEIHRQLDMSICNVNATHEKMISHPTFKAKNVTNGDKIATITTRIDRCPTAGIIDFGGYIRLITPMEASKAQGVPYSYIHDMCKTNQFSILGNGWTIPIIAHCLSFMK